MGKIYVELRSGLGNQLFQYAFAYRLAKEFDKRLVLCPAYFDSFWKYWTKKFLKREARRLRLPLLISPDVGLAVESRETVLKQTSLPILDENHLTINEVKAVCQNTSDVYLRGYWQMPGEFVEVYDELSSTIHPTFALSKKFKKMHDAIDENSVALHVRRGDFLTNRSFGACTLDFYAEAIEYIKSVVSNPNFVVFTNDSTWAQDNLSGIVNFTLYRNNTTTNTDIEEMFLMSKFRSLVISNSTFSWWSAFLNRRQQRTIVTPAIWFLNNTLQQNAASLIQPSWKAIKNELRLAN